MPTDNQQTKQSDIVKWGIIGCGNVTEKKSGPAFQTVENSQLIAVMRRTASLAQDYAKRHKVPRWYSDADELIQDPEINAVYIATPPSSHAELAIRAMVAGKAVYVEKPMACSYQECMAMLEVSKKQAVPLFVAYYRRTLPGFLKVKELLDSGIIGTPMVTNIRLFRGALPAETSQQNQSWRVDPRQAGGGIFYDLASHQLDFLDYCFGPIISINGNATNIGKFYDAEDTVSASFQFENGVLGTGAWSFVTDASCEEDTMEIIGTLGKIEFSGFKHHPIMLKSTRGDIEFPYLNPENIQYNLIHQVVETLQGNMTCASTGETAMRTNKVMEAIVKNYYA